MQGFSISGVWWHPPSHSSVDTGTCVSNGKRTLQRSSRSLCPPLAIGSSPARQCRGSRSSSQFQHSKIQAVAYKQPCGHNSRKVLIQQGDTSVPKGHQGITWPTGQQLATTPGHGEQKQTHFSSLSQCQAHHSGQGITSQHLHRLELPTLCPDSCIGSSLLAAGPQLHLLHFGISHALSHPPGPGWPQQRAKLTTALTDASTPFIHPHTLLQERGERESPAAAPGGASAPGITLLLCFLPFHKLNC